MDTSQRLAPPLLLAVCVVLFALLVLAQLVQAFGSRRADGVVDLQGIANVARGSLCSVLLVNGQMYYGTLAKADGGFVTLSDIYYVRASPQATGNSPANQLVSRRKEDWHSPEWMAIPIDRVVFIEAVGPKSRLALLIAGDHAKSAQP